MSPLQKEIFIKLFSGYNIASNPTGVFRLRDADHRVNSKNCRTTFKHLKPYLRKANGLFIIDKNAVRQASGNTWIKKYYKSISK